MAAPSITLDKPSYNKGDKGTLTVVDPTRVTTSTITVPSINGPLTVALNVDLPSQTPVDTGARAFTLVSDDPSTGKTVWSFTA